MQKNKSSRKISQLISSFFGRFHIIIFTLVAIGGLAFVIFIIYSLIFTTNPEDSSETGISFDQSTIKNIETLHTSDEPNEPIASNPTNSPFLNNNN